MPTEYKPLPFHKVNITDQFWAPRIKTNAGATLTTQYQNLVETGRLPAFKLDWHEGMEPIPHIFWDSDVAKWVEGACYSINLVPDAKIEKMLDEAIDLIISAQQPDGYLNIHFTVVEPEKRWTNLRDWHELYCAGHLMEAAVAHFRATGSRKFLDAMCRYADYIASVFGVEPGKKRGYCGHPEIELALVKLYEATGEERYFKLSEYFVEQHGQQPHYFDVEAVERGEVVDLDHLPPHMLTDRYAYAQADVPVREQKSVAGHAVRAMYFYSGAADIAGINNDESLFTVLQRLLNDLTTKRMYITGGIGPSRHNEGFTTDYDLPNDTAYAETCAAIGLVMWNHRMLRYDLNSSYSDVMELALYNGTISGISLSGDRYFYENPLASNGSHHRVDWFGCSCCPPNIFRMMASVGGYAYSYTETDAIVHLYMQSECELEVGGKTVKLSQKTNYPWDGCVGITVGLEQPAEFAIKLRKPGWCDDFNLSINGVKQIDVAVEKGYINLHRTWKDGDVIELDLPMVAKRIYANPAVSQDIGRVAIRRGPVVYCLEQVDNQMPSELIQLPDQAELVSTFEPDLLGGVVTVTADATSVSSEGWDEALYKDQPAATKPCTIQAVPYYAWDNREAGWMSVWLRR
ncbi:MAG: glycoside hydrolase family 127 protein [Armatimonadota bacterium]